MPPTAVVLGGTTPVVGAGSPTSDGEVVATAGTLTSDVLAGKLGVVVLKIGPGT